MFPNDEDLLGGFAKDPMGTSVFGLETWSRFLETALRLKANTVQAGTVSYPDEQTVQLIGRRGLVTTASHFNLLGSNTYRWPVEMGKGAWDWEREPQAMSHMWRASIAAQKDTEVLWSVGLRGLTDSEYTACGGDTLKCAEAINNVVSNQTAWIREAQGPSAVVIWFLFGAAAQYLQMDLLKKDPSVIFINADDYPYIGTVRATELTPLTGGLYYHAAWFSTYTAQLSEMVPPSVMMEQIGTFMRHAKSTSVFILNVSDLLPILMLVEAILRFIWSPALVDTAATTHESQHAVVQRWAMREYTDGNTAMAHATSEVMDRYYDLVQVTAGDMAGLVADNTTCGDVWLANLSRSIAWCAMANLEGAGNVTAAQAVLSTCHCSLGEQGGSQNTLSTLSERVAATNVTHALGELEANSAALYHSIAAAGSSGAAYFQASVLLQHTMYHQLWVASKATANAVLSFKIGMKDAVDGNFTLAFAAFEAIAAAQRKAEGVRWRGLYAADKITDIHRSRRVVRQLQGVFANFLADAPLHQSMPTLADTGGSMYQFYDYQHQHQQSFPYMRTSSQWNLYRLVRIQCAPGSPLDLRADGATPEQQLCLNRPDGGVFWPGGGRVVMHALRAGDDGCEIKYTVDGTPPGANSPQYSPSQASLTINATTTFRAALLCASQEGSDLVSKLTFTAV